MWLIGVKRFLVGGSMPSVLPQNLLRGKSTMTRLVAKLVHAGYIERRVDPNDGRGFLVSLTDHGAAVLRTAASRQHAYLARQLDALDATDREMLLAAAPVLEKLLAVKA